LVEADVLSGVGLSFWTSRYSMTVTKKPAALIFAFGAALMAATLGARGDQPAPKPYSIQNGKVDKKTYNGWRRYTESCMRCHGPDGAGSSYAPDLVDSAKHMTQDQFNEIVVNGKTEVNTANQNVMPPFGTVEDVMNYLDDIWAYLKARADGAVGRGRPPRIGD
jgi:mono/diheme cytochrome c family protein